MSGEHRVSVTSNEEADIIARALVTMCHQQWRDHGITKAWIDEYFAPEELADAHKNHDEVSKNHALRIYEVMVAWVPMPYPLDLFESFSDMSYEHEKQRMELEKANNDH